MQMKVYLTSNLGEFIAQDVSECWNTFSMSYAPADMINRSKFTLLAWF